MLVCVVVLLPGTRPNRFPLVTRPVHLLHRRGLLQLPLLLVLLLRGFVVVYLLCVCAEIKKNHKVENPAKTQE